MLLQTRYTRVFDDVSVKDAETNDGFALNRAFLRGVVHPYKWLSAKLLVDFAEFAYSNPQQALKLAYGEIKPIKRIEFTFGLFKRTYSLLELLPIAEYELADTGPTDNLIKDTQFGGRDAGAMLRGDPLPKRRWLHIYLGAFGGAGEGAEGIPGTNGNVNTGPDLAAPSLLLTARLMSRPLKHLSLGVDGAWRPNGTPAVSLPPQSQVTSGKATSADATYSTQFLELRGEWLWGDRTDIAYRGDARTWMAAWGSSPCGFRSPTSSSCRPLASNGSTSIASNREGSATSSPVRSTSTSPPTFAFCSTSRATSSAPGPPQRIPRRACSRRAPPSSSPRSS